jgi:hypothetical protein
VVWLQVVTATRPAEAIATLVAVRVRLEAGELVADVPTDARVPRLRALVEAHRGMVAGLLAGGTENCRRRGFPTPESRAGALAILGPP